nr:hypothetical protein [Thermococcus sp. 101 C5]
MKLEIKIVMITKGRDIGGILIENPTTEIDNIIRACRTAIVDTPKSFLVCTGFFLLVKII